MLFILFNSNSICFLCLEECFRFNVSIYAIIVFQLQLMTPFQAPLMVCNDRNVYTLDVFYADNVFLVLYLDLINGVQAKISEATTISTLTILLLNVYWLIFYMVLHSYVNKGSNAFSIAKDI